MYLRDLSSTNGTFVNRKRVSEALLEEGDILHFAEVEFRIGRCALGATQRNSDEGTLTLRRLDLPHQFISGTRELNRLLDEEMVTAAFQPIVSLPAGEILAYEVLGRGTQSGGKVQVTKKGLWISIVSGILMGSWSPLTAASMADGTGQLTPYTSIVVFTFATLVSTFFFNVYFMQKPLSGEPVSFEGYLQGKPSWHVLGLTGGFIWSIGTAANLIAGREAGFAVAYAMGQSAPMVAALWGVFVWNEFEGASSKAKMYLAAMFVFYAGAIAVIANAF